MLLLIFSMACLACAKRENSVEQVRVVTVQGQFTRCPTPSSPVLLPLNGTQHIGSKQNVQTLISNVMEMQSAIEARDAALHCYEAQAEDVQ